MATILVEATYELTIGEIVEFYLWEEDAKPSMRGKVLRQASWKEYVEEQKTALGERFEPRHYLNTWGRFHYELEDLPD